MSHKNEFLSSGLSPTSSRSTTRKRKRNHAPAAPVINPEPLLLDIHGAARALSATPWAVRSLLWDKQIPYIKIGRRFLVDPADLRLFIERNKEAV